MGICFRCLCSSRRFSLDSLSTLPLANDSSTRVLANDAITLNEGRTWSRAHLGRRVWRPVFDVCAIPGASASSFTLSLANDEITLNDSGTWSFGWPCMGICFR